MHLYHNMKSISASAVDRLGVEAVREHRLSLRPSQRSSQAVKPLFAITESLRCGILSMINRWKADSSRGTYQVKARPQLEN